MSLPSGYLTAKQRTFWGLRRRGSTQADISREMAVTRQTVNKVFNAIDSKVSKALLETAQVNRLEVSRVDSEKGFLVGRSPSLGLDALVTFSERNGIQVWYEGEGSCSECSWFADCRRKLVAEAEERGIRLPENAEVVEPSKLADVLIKGIVEE